MRVDGTRRHPKPVRGTRLCQAPGLCPMCLITQNGSFVTRMALDRFDFFDFRWVTTPKEEFWPNTIYLTRFLSFYGTPCHDLRHMVALPPGSPRQGVLDTGG